MPITLTSAAGDGTQKMYTASYFDDAASPVTPILTPGFRPRYVCVDNITDRIKWEWYEGAVSATCVQTVAAGTRTLITTAGVTVTVAEGSQPSIAFPVLQNKQYRIQATA